MKKSVSVLLLLVVISVANENEAILAFIRSSLSPANVTHFGLSSLEERGGLTLGAEIALYNVRNDSLRLYPESSIATKASTQFRVVEYNGVAQFLVLVDSIRGPVAIGYRQLAEELKKMESLFSINASEVVLYRATQINSFLFSIPTSTTRYKNLTILRPEWNKARTPLVPFEKTVLSLCAGLEK